jgi:serine/threonine-protein kinase
MPDDPRVQRLLDELLDSHVSPEEVCGPCPELLPLVRERWREMCRAQAELDALFPPMGEAKTMPPVSPPGDTPLPVIPGYEVEAVLGHGGMGVVFRARHTRLNRVVALKMALAGAYAGTQERERFQREAEAVAALRHPNVVQIYDVGDSDGRPFFTMEHVEGGSLAQKLAGMPQAAREAAALVATLAGAVQAAHASGIVHRDLKPGNVLLTADGTPKVGDFGLARRLVGEAALTGTGAVLGTPSYMAPEQARGQIDAVGPAADVYALGAILYECLAGRPPFRAETAAETLLQVTSQDPVPPSRLNGKVPRDLETICLKCLHKGPELRYASAGALADDIDRFLRGEAIAARPEGNLARLARRVRRRPLVSGAVALATLSTMALLGGGLWLLFDRATTVRAAEADLRDMVGHLNASSWLEARAARDRASGRLGSRAPARLSHLIDQGTRDLELAVRLDDIRLEGSDIVGRGVAASEKHYAEALREAGLGTVQDDPEVVAARISSSNIRAALVAALDHWSVLDRESPGRKAWALEVARKADPDQSDWRVRARTPDVRKDQAALAELIATAPVAGAPVSLLLALEMSLLDPGTNRLAYLKRIQQAHPNDLWANQRLGFVLASLGKPGEAIGYFQAALAVRPGSGLMHHNLAHVLDKVGRREEAVTEYRRAIELAPRSGPVHVGLVQVLCALGRFDEAHAVLPTALRLEPRIAILHTAYGVCLERKGRQDEALRQHREAVVLDPKIPSVQKELRNFLMRRGELNEALLAWQAASEASPGDHDACYGYAELCLFLGQEEQYRRARQALLSRFGTATDPYLCERTARACLLRPASGDELRQAATLAERAVAVDPAKHPIAYPCFLFAQGLAEHRRGRYERAISLMRGPASAVLGPAPRLVLAMALHQSGKVAEARKELAAAVPAHDWRAQQARDQDGWIFHVLRREAESMILPRMSDFLEGKYQPQDNDERLALLGVCWFTNRTRAIARLYAAAFAADPRLVHDTGAGHRWRAARAAILAGWGVGEDAKGLAVPEKRRLRAQAREWLRADLVLWGGALAGAPAGAREGVRHRLAEWRADPDLAGLRDPAPLEKLSAAERKDCLALWAEVSALFDRCKP